MFKCKLLFLSLAFCAVPALQAQRLPTATRAVDIQAGGGYVYGHSDYGRTLSGYGVYGTVDFRYHFGVELEYHKASGSDLIYEKTYEVGPRYVWHYGRLNPYGKFMVGRGVFNFPPYEPGGESRANLAYNMYAFGGGVDYRVKRYLNVRGDFEYQEWGSDTGFLPHGLAPYLGTIGVAYHFR
jgi:hypothetical protein